MNTNKDSLDSKSNPIPSVFVPLEKIQTRDEIKGRLKTIQKVVKEYASMMKSGVKFPPVTLFELDDELILVDGFHRFEAAKLLGRTTVEAAIQIGRYRDALEFALYANSKHGLRLSSKDKRRNTEVALGLNPGWSDRKIAELVGASHTTVGVIRKEIQLAESASWDGKQIGRDGKVRRRKRAPATTIQSNPKPSAQISSSPPQMNQEDKRKMEVISNHPSFSPEAVSKAITGQILWDAEAMKPTAREIYLQRIRKDLDEILSKN